MSAKLQSHDESHRSVNFSYLDMYEEEINKQKRAHEAFKNAETIEKGEVESKKPAFFQKDERLNEASKALRDQEGDIEPWRLEEYEAYKKLQ